MGQIKVRISQTFVAMVAIMIVAGLVGCNSPGTPVLAHKLVATGGQTSIPLYSDEQTLVEVSHRAQQGGVTGMVGSVQKDMSAKQIDDQTPVNVISTDDNATQVEIIDGPMKGQRGFVPKQNVN
jgi:hypothetical protein